MARRLSFHPFKFAKRYMPKNLFGRTLTILLTPVLIIMVVITFVFFDRHWSSITHRFANDIAGDVMAIITMLEEDGVAFDKVQAFAQKQFDMKIAQGDKLHDYGHSSVILRELGADYLSTALSNRSIAQPFYIGLDSDWVYISIKRPDNVLDITINRKRLLSKTTTIFLFWLFGAPLLLLIIAIVFLRNQIRPILRLAVAVDRFGKGKDVSGFKPEGASEVRKAAVAFNQMRERIRRQITQRTDMLAGVSHDLRTPLTRMKLQVAMLEDKVAKAGLLKDIDDAASKFHVVDKLLENETIRKKVDLPGV